MTGNLYPRVLACRTALELLRVLLAWCREEARQFRAWEADPANRAITHFWALRAAETVGKLTDPGFFSPQDLALIQKYFHPPQAIAPSRTECVVETRALAEEIEEQLGNRLVPLLQLEYAPTKVVEPGHLFPVVHNPAVPGWMGVGKRTSFLTSRPESQCPPVDRLVHFGLGPSAGEVALEIDVRMRRLASPVPSNRPLRLGVGVLNGGREDLPPTTDYPTDGEFLVCHTAARCATQREAMRAVVRMADEHGVDVLVFPELCTDDASVTDLEAEFARTRHLWICVFGSYHARGRAGWRNTAWGRVRGSPVVLEHHKLERYPLPAKDSPTKTELREGIRTGERVRVYHGRNWSATVLICLDFMSDRVLPAVQELRPTLVLVPAFTPKTTRMSGSANALANASQTITVLANGPVLADRIVGVFGVPRTYPSCTVGEHGWAGRGPDAAVPLPQDRQILPTLCVFEVDTGQILFLPE